MEPRTEEFALGVLLGGPAPAAATTVLGSAEELRGAFNQVAASAQRLISIHARHLEPAIFDHADFLGIVKRFALGRNFAKVRVLLSDDSGQRRESSRFVGMARRLPSYIDIRIAQAGLPQSAAACIIADDCAVALHTNARGWSGLANFDCPPVARAQLAGFEAAWEANEPALAAARAGGR